MLKVCAESGLLLIYDPGLGLVSFLLRVLECGINFVQSPLGRGQLSGEIFVGIILFAVDLPSVIKVNHSEQRGYKTHLFPVS